MRTALIAVAMGVATVVPAASKAELIRYSTGYPSTAETDGRPTLGATIGAGPGAGFVVTSARLNPASDVVLTEMRGVGFPTLQLANVLNFDWQWDLHSSLQHAIDFPLEGNVIHVLDVPLASGPTAFGTIGVRSTYLVTFDLSPYSVVLDGGSEYWSTFAAVSVTGADGFWAWVETMETGPSDIGRNNTGAWVSWSDVGGHSTGRAAQDYFAIAVPEPSSFILGSLVIGIGTLFLISARRRR